MAKAVKEYGSLDKCAYPYATTMKTISHRSVTELIAMTRFDPMFISSDNLSRLYEVEAAVMLARLSRSGHGACDGKGNQDGEA